MCWEEDAKVLWVGDGAAATKIGGDMLVELDIGAGAWTVATSNGAAPGTIGV